MSHSLLNSAPNFDARFAFGWALLALSASAVPLNGHPLNLQRARISSGYRRTLDGAYDKLTLWCVVHGRPLPHTLENNLQALNTLLVDHLQFLYDEKYGVSAGRHALLAVQTRLRSLRGRLTEPWDSMRSWEMLAPKKNSDSHALHRPSGHVRFCYGDGIQQYWACRPRLDLFRRGPHLQFRWLTPPM